MHEEVDLAILKLVHGGVIHTVLKLESEDIAFNILMITDMLDY